MRPWTYATLGTSVALLFGALGLDLASRSSASAAREELNPTRYAELYDEAHRHQTGARVLLGLGLAATAATGVLLYFDLRRGAARGQHPRSVAASFGQAGFSITVTQGF